MRFVMLRAIVLAFGLVLAAVLPASAESPVGTWRLDEAAYRAQVDAMLDRMLAQLPPEQREQMRQMMQAGDGPLEQELASRLEFRPDGTVAASEGEDGAMDAIATWRADGDTIVMTSSEAGVDAPDMVGSFDGGALVFQFAPDATQHSEEELAWMRDFRITLIRE